MSITKDNGIWKGYFFRKISGTNWKLIDILESDSYGGLMLKVGENNWIDKINKNPEEDGN